MSPTPQTHTVRGWAGIFLILVLILRRKDIFSNVQGRNQEQKQALGCNEVSSRLFGSLPACEDSPVLRKTAESSPVTQFASV